MGRALRHGAAALILAVPIAGALQALHANAAVTIYYPDLQMVVPTETIQINHPTGMPKELRFTHITSNLGDGPLEIQPTYDPTTGTAVGQQNLYSKDSTGKWILASTVPVGGTFVWDPAHGHYHWPLASYGLYTVTANGSVGTAVAMSPKVGFCIAEDYAVNLELPNAPQSIFYNGNTCTDPTAVRGLSVGWGDEYDWTDPGESIDITSVPDGIYWFRSMVDPNGYLSEKDKTNNTRDIKLQIAGDTVSLLNPLPSIGGFTFDQSFLQKGTGTVSTPTFTAAAGARLMALVASDGTSGARQTVTVSGLGLNWTLASRSNTQNGLADVWSASTASQVTGMVTSTQSTGGLDQSLTVLSVLGSGGIGATAANNALSGAPAVSLTTTRAGSWVLGVGNDPNHPTFRAIGPNQTMVNEWVDFQCVRPGSTTCSLWTQATSAPIPAAGTIVQLSDAYPTIDWWNFAAVELMRPVPGAPTNVSAGPGDTSATVSWTAPTSDGGSPITGDRVTPYIGATAQSATIFTSTATTQTISGLTNGTTYTFTVAAINAVGTGPDSAPSNAVTPRAPYVAGVVGTNGGLYTLASGASGFTADGGVLLGAPAVVSIPQTSGPGLPLYLATGSDHNLYVRNDTKGWQPLTTSPFSCFDNPAGVVIGSTLYVACEGANNGLWHAEVAAPTGTNLPTLPFSAWQSLGGVLLAGPSVAAVAGTPTYVVVGTGNQVYQRTLTTGYSAISSWRCTGHLALAASGSTTYFACHGLDGALYYATNPGGGWSAAQSLGGLLIDGPGIAAAASGPIFFAEGGDHALYHRSIAGPWIRDGGQLQFGAAAAAL